MIDSAQGYVQYNNTFIPQVWSTNLILSLYDATVLAYIANTDYEGEIKNQGDEVIIRQRPTININDYEKGGTLVHQRPEASTLSLLIDKAKYFDFVLDNIDEHQTDIQLMSEFSDDASEQMKIEIDTDVLQTIYALPHASNQGIAAGVESGDIDLGAEGDPVELTKENILDTIIDSGTVLDEQNCPESDRFCIIPPWASGMIKKSDLKDASMTGDGTSALRSGRLGMIDRFTLYNSNNLYKYLDSSTYCWNIMCGHKMALTFAAQMTEMDTLKAESTFGKIVRGLNVYGFQVVKPEALATIYASKGTYT